MIKISESKIRNEEDDWRQSSWGLIRSALTWKIDARTTLRSSGLRARPQVHEKSCL